ncbi:MarR family winged helix-turn-helix transcriptional regulator [Nonomuraea salmonea]|uniref:MarR family winged helix-turn-helix transcriptional regulator n=1 Tax=Nonomuraea salmonea TaxID=46181 RepID=UPI0036099DA1
MREPRWLSPAEQRAWRTHLAVHKLLMHRLDRELHAHSLSLNDYEILVNLSESPGRRMRMSELADVTIQSRSRLSHQISRMEAKGLVTREDCRDDRRGTYAVLTDEGWETIQRVALPREGRARALRRPAHRRPAGGDRGGVRADRRAPEEAALTPNRYARGATRPPADR